MKKILNCLLVLVMVLTISGCSQDNNDESAIETILIAAAASLKNAFEDELIDMFEANNPNIKVAGSYDSSGKLQEQIENGLEADVFFSAATKQMDELISKGYINDDSRVDLLENQVVLIVSSQSDLKLEKFSDIVNADSIALGDPDSVPAGQYAKEALSDLGLWQQVSDKASLATNVTEVLNQVAEGSAQCGIVYASDAYIMENKVEVVASVPAGSLVTPVLYPVATLKNARDSAVTFVEFLQSDEALEVFERYGFTKY